MSWRPQNKAALETHVLVRTGSYSYVHVCTGMYWYVLVHTSMYFINVQTCTCQYVNVHTGTYAYMPFLTFSKKVQTGLEPAIFCVPRAEFTPALRSTDLNADEI